MYAHVATEAAHPGKLALQYWFFYPFNDFNNTHEGDWEMIQLLFDADDAAEALETTPTRGRVQLARGGRASAWDDEDKLEIVDGTHPVVHPAAGSHANKFGEALYLGSSAEQGVGCDNTIGPHVEIRPTVLTIPSDPAAARAAYPWITFEGRWGELQPAFYNGPTGPNLKDAVDRTRSRGRRPGATGATPSRPAAPSAQTRPTSSATAVARGSTWLTARAPKPGADAAPARSRDRSRRPRRRDERRGSPSPPSGSPVAARGGRSCPPRRACTSAVRGSSSGSGCC